MEYGASLRKVFRLMPEMNWTLLKIYGDYPSRFLEDLERFLQADAFSQLA